MSLKAKGLKVFRYFKNRNLYKNGLASLLRLKNLKEDPIIICGAPRSGTTLLISILDSHPDIVAIPYETRLFKNKKAKRWFPWNSWNNWFVKLQIKALLITTAIRPNSKRWCEKTPSHLFYLDYIFSLYQGKVKVIQIIRDGRDVVLSHHGRLGYIVTPDIWSKFIQEGLKYINEPKVLMIKYEDIVLNFDSTMQHISDFLKIENTFNQEYFQQTGVSENVSIVDGYSWKGVYSAKPISKDSLYKWKRHPDVIKQFEENPVAKKLLLDLGY